MTARKRVSLVQESVSIFCRICMNLLHVLPVAVKCVEGGTLQRFPFWPLQLWGQLQVLPW